MDRNGWNERYADHDGNGPGTPSAVLERIVGPKAQQGGSMPPACSEPGTALDLAAGTGRNALYLARLGWRVTAVDFADVAVRRGKALSERLGLPVEWRVEDLASYEPPEASFDLVCLFYLHMPWDRLSEVMARAARAVRTDGCLLIVGHDVRNLSEGRGGPQDPAILYTPERIAKVIRPLTHVHYAQSEVNEVDHGDAQTSSDEPTGQVDTVVVARRKG